VPIGVLTFFGGFFPIVGAIAVGALAALVALVAKGPVAALVVVGVTIVIHNVEGYLVGPLVSRAAVRLHPVAVLLALAVGGVLAGIIGAFVAVPTAAVIAAASTTTDLRSSPTYPSPNSAARAIDVPRAEGEAERGRLRAASGIGGGRAQNCSGSCRVVGVVGLAMPGATLAGGLRATSRMS